VKDIAACWRIKFLHILQEVRGICKTRNHLNNTECRKLLQVDLQRASYLLKKLMAEGSLKREGERRWARYRLA